MQDLAASLLQLPNGLEVRSVVIESAAGEQSIALPVDPNAALPVVEGPFTIKIDLTPGPP